MSNGAGSPLDVNMSGAAFRALWPDRYDALKIDNVPITEAQIPEYGGQLWANGVDDAIIALVDAVFNVSAGAVTSRQDSYDDQAAVTVVLTASALLSLGSDNGYTWGLSSTAGAGAATLTSWADVPGGVNWTTATVQAAAGTGIDGGDVLHQTAPGATGVSQVGPLAGGNGGDITAQLGAGANGIGGAAGESSPAGSGGTLHYIAGKGGDAGAGAENSSAGAGGDFIGEAGIAGTPVSSLGSASGGSAILRARESVTPIAAGLHGKCVSEGPAGSASGDDPIHRFINRGAGTGGGGTSDLFVIDGAGTPSHTAETGSLAIVNDATGRSRLYQCVGPGLATSSVWRDIAGVALNYTPGAAQIAPYSPAVGEHVRTDASGGTFLNTLPAGAIDNDRIAFVDVSGTATTTTLDTADAATIIDPTTGVPVAVATIPGGYASITFKFDATSNVWRIE